jgi:hypothetical protein
LKSDINNICKQYQIVVVLYGLTGISDTGGCGDINHVVNTWLDRDPMQRSKVTCGVVTDIGSYDAVSKYGYTFSPN